MNKIKKFVTKYFKDFAFYFGYLRHRITLGIFISIIVGLLDGIGLTMFLPLLQIVSGATDAGGTSMGKLEFLVDGIQAMGLDLTLMSVLAIMVIFFSLKGLMVYINALYGISLLQLFIKRLRKNLLRSFNQISYKYFVTSDIGRIQNTLTGEVDRVARSFRDYFYTLEKGLLVAVYTVFAFLIDAQFALLVTLAGLLTNVLYVQLYKRTKSKSREFTEDSHSYQGQIVQHVANFKYLKATALVDRFSAKLEESIDSIEHSRKEIGVYAAILSAVREPMMIIIVAGVIIVQTQVFQRPMGGIILSLLFFYRALTSIVMLQTFWNKFLEVSGSLENVQDFHKELKQNKDTSGKEQLSHFSDTIQLNNASFTYGEAKILTDISLKVSKNETLAFVGESGSGKTTLVNILAGLTPLDKGDMYIDDNDTRNLDIKSYQERIGYITQDPVISTLR